MKYEIKGGGFWLDDAVNALLAYLESRGVPQDETVTCAAGMTPSCPIHFGIFREILISYFVARELKKRGRTARLVYYWDDYDHFCKIPWYAARDQVEEHIGKPLVEVPDFQGTDPSYGEHHMRVFEENLACLGVNPEYNYQARMYAQGQYTDRIRTAINRRGEIFDIIHRDKQPYTPEMLAAREAYYPLEIYCSACGKDKTKTTGWDETQDRVSYECQSCGNRDTYRLTEGFRGKLVWKANWAMRWTHDNVLFESSGENQLTDTGSYAVSSKIAHEIFGGEAPFSLLYRFIGIPGTAKVSRAQGERTLSSRLAGLLEPAIVRWLFLKHGPEKVFTIDLDNGLKRIYQEWDQFVAKVRGGQGSEDEKRIFRYATENVRYCGIPIPFTTMLAALGITQGDERKTAKLLNRDFSYGLGGDAFFAEIYPRFLCAKKFVYEYNMTDDVPVLLNEPQEGNAQEIPENVRRVIDGLLEGLPGLKAESEIQELLYNLPKKVLNIPLEEQKNQDVKALQKEVYRTLYLLLLGKEQGPRLATLLSLVEYSQIKKLLKGRTH